MALQCSDYKAVWREEQRMGVRRVCSIYLERYHNTTGAVSCIIAHGLPPLRVSMSACMSPAQETEARFNIAQGGLSYVCCAIL